jgi:hypothetical protein
MDVTVHILHHGLPLCRFSTALPRDWPEGHKWTGLDEIEDARCGACMAAAPPRDQAKFIAKNWAKQGHERGFLPEIVPLGDLILAIAGAITAAHQTGVEAMRELAGYVAIHACLTPPDGGSPTEDEREMCAEVARQIYAATLPLSVRSDG